LSGERPTDAPELQRCLREVLGTRAVRIVEHEQLKADVHRLRVAGGGAERSVVVKWSDAVIARRCRLVAWQWLPAAGLEDVGAPLLAVAADQNGDRAWHVYEDLPGRPLSTKRPVDEELEAAIAAIARVHTAFAEHPLLRECRLGGGDRGIHFYSANVRDAVIALRSLDASPARDALLERMSCLEDEESERAQVLAAKGGPETLVHGDLWPSNVIVLTDGDSPAVRLIDWDEAGVGPIGFDLSTFLLRFDSSHRRWIADAYRRAVGRLAGWDLPDERDLNVIFETAAYARLASLLVWSVAAASEGESDWLVERLADLVEWFDEVAPVLPAR
jgi:Ser/Thr protein kinase RdoA (MazF antagonist)